MNPKNKQTTGKDSKVATPLTTVPEKPVGEQKTSPATSPEESAEEFYDDVYEQAEEIVSPTLVDLPVDILEESKKVDANVRRFIAFNRKGESVKAFNWKVIPSVERQDKNGKVVKTTPMLEFTQILNGKGVLARCVASQMLVTQLVDRAAKGIKVVVITYTHTEKPANGRSFKNFVVLPKDK